LPAPGERFENRRPPERKPERSNTLKEQNTRKDPPCLTPLIAGPQWAVPTASRMCENSGCSAGALSGGVFNASGNSWAQPTGKPGSQAQSLNQGKASMPARMKVTAWTTVCFTTNEANLFLGVRVARSDAGRLRVPVQMSGTRVELAKMGPQFPPVGRAHRRAWAQSGSRTLGPTDSYVPSNCRFVPCARGISRLYKRQTRQSASVPEGMGNSSDPPGGIIACFHPRPG
jgi:hypothetical protein